MNSISVLAVMFLSLGAIASVGAAQVSPWSGTWAFNASKSTSPGPDRVIAIKVGGEVVINSTRGPLSFYCNEKPYPWIDGATIVCLKLTGKVMDTRVTYPNNLVQVSHDEVSNDGMEMSQTVTTHKSDGTQQTKSRVLLRMTASNDGIGGLWKDKDGAERVPKIMVTRLAGNVFSIDFPSAKQHTEGRLDGSPSTVQGTSAFIHGILAFKTTGPLRIETMKREGGSLISQGSLNLSPDGKTLIEETWNPANPKLKRISVYEKQ